MAWRIFFVNCSLEVLTNEMREQAFLGKGALEVQCRVMVV